jgi:hypothetical protein
MEDVDNNPRGSSKIVVTPGPRGFIVGTTKRLSIGNSRFPVRVEAPEPARAMSEQG